MSIHAGRVIAFDEARGLGEIQDERDAAVYRFHCTQIADGTRGVPVGTLVTFALFDHPVGGTEATNVDRA